MTDHDGTEIDYTMVKILDAASFERVFQLELAMFNDALINIRAGDDTEKEMAKALLGTRAWELKDGSLLIRRSDRPDEEIILPNDAWTLVVDANHKHH